MSGYTEACGDVASNDAIVATGGINKKASPGYWESLFYAKDDFTFSGVSSFKDKDDWDAAVLAGNLIYLGKGKFEDTSTEATFFEDAALDFKELQTPKIKSFKFSLIVCACTSAQLEKMEGKQGRLFVQTSKGFGLGRLMEDGKVQGKAVSSITVDDTLPTNNTPVSYTTLDIAFSDAKGDRQNPWEAKLDFLFSEVDQVYSLTSSVSAVSSNGSALSATVVLYKECSDVKLAGMLLANMKAEDENGNAITIASFTDTSGSYAAEFTTALTKVYLYTDGIKTVGGNNYYLPKTTIST